MTDDQQPEHAPADDDTPAWPVPDDLSLVLARVTRSRKSRAAAKRLANSPETRAYLDAGLRLIFEQLTASSVEPENPEYTERPFFAWLSRNNVYAEVSKVENNFQPGDGTFRDRWEFVSSYIEDLLAYSLWAVHWSAHVTTAQESASVLTQGEDFAEGIRELAYLDMQNVLENPAYRVSVIGSAMADRDARAREVVTQTYHLVLDSWKQLYVETIQARGLKLRPGVSLDDLASMLAALADGIGLRLIAERDNTSLIDHEKRTSLLGKAAMALVVACVDPGDGLGLDELVSMFSSPPDAEA